MYLLAFHRLPRPLVTLFIAVVALLAVSCGSDGDGNSVVGEIRDIEARSITEFETLTIIDGDGKTWEFVGGAFSGFTPSHLREHQALGEPVEVWFVEEDGKLRVTRIGDG